MSSSRCRYLRVGQAFRCLLQRVTDGKERVSSVCECVLKLKRVLSCNLAIVVQVGKQLCKNS